MSALQETLKGITDPRKRMEFIDDAFRPPEPQLLDTCVLQNLDWVDRQLEEKERVVWDDAALLELSARYGSDTANDLVDLGILYKQFEYWGGYPWLVCETNWSEASVFGGNRSARLRIIVKFFGGHQEDVSNDAFPGVALGLLGDSRSARISPLILKGLGVRSLGQIFASDGPLSFLRDEGDRRVAGYALVANIPAILTTDRKTFWKHRDVLRNFGVEVMRPSELLDLYEPYWAALSNEFQRRQNESSPSSPGRH
ncbi:hypothetical protein HYPDE_27658 [Hyphomicrobium denitrificans 1NES1]|uniref:Uncharacterized protein n=2 Tax=Hyphomicrobium denitrificans TaxID=53399 RepID=N0B9K2_9HYPH|nr:hypothetical protein HYPDE_27658 [Hyphomicrobium denitrificans 1NES1]